MQESTIWYEQRLSLETATGELKLYMQRGGTAAYGLPEENPLQRDKIIYSSESFAIGITCFEELAFCVRGLSKKTPDAKVAAWVGRQDPVVLCSFLVPLVGGRRLVTSELLFGGEMEAVGWGVDECLPQVEHAVVRFCTTETNLLKPICMRRFSADFSSGELRSEKKSREILR
jgi:hypothetical protein